MLLRSTNNREENTPAAIFRVESLCTSFESGNMFLYIDPTIVPAEDSYAESDSLSFDRLLVTRQNHSQAPICTRPLDTPLPDDVFTLADEINKDQIARSNSLGSLASASMGNRESAIICFAHLAASPPLRTPNLYVGGQRSKNFRRACADAQRILVVLLRQFVRNPLHLGSRTRSALHRQPRLFQPLQEPPARGVHHRRIPERLFRLLLDVRKSVFLRRLRSFFLIAFVAGERQIRHPIRSVSVP